MIRDATCKCIRESVATSVIVLAALIQHGCSASGVYSPTLILPREPARHHDTQLAIGFGLFPETRPRAVGRSVSECAEAVLGYGFNSNLELRAKTWYTFQGDGGVMIDAVVRLSDSSAQFPVALIPRAAVLFAERYVQGYGVAIETAVWFPPLGDLTFYAGAGPAIGVYSLSFGFEGGYGLLASLGACYSITDRFSVNLEVAGIAQFNRYDHETDLLASPAIAIGYRF